MSFLTLEIAILFIKVLHIDFFLILISLNVVKRSLLLYINTLRRELVDTYAYKLLPSLKRGRLSMGMVVIQPYILVSRLKKIKTKLLRCTGYLNSIKPYKARFIANSIFCTTTEFSKLLTSRLSAVKNMLSSIVKRYMRDLVKTYFGLSKIQVKF